MIFLEHNSLKNLVKNKKVMVHLFAISGLCSITGWLFRKVFTSEIIFGSDIVFEFFYKRGYGFGELLKGEVPLWNPHQFCGYPFVADIQTAIFYPLNVLFLIFNTGTAFTLSSFIHVILSGLGMYLYVWHLIRKPFPSFIAGFIYMTSGFFMSHLYGGHVGLICAYPWLPLIIFSLDKSLRENSWQWTCIGGMFLGCQLLAGYPLITLYTTIALILYTLGWGWMLFRKKNSLKRIATSFYPVVVILVLGILISAVQLIPTYIFSAYSVRSKAMTYEFATSCSFPPENFITYIAPYFFGDMATVRYWGRWILWEVFPYVGVLPLVFFIITGFSERKIGRFIACLGFLAVLLSFGKHASYYRLIYTFVPGFSLFRVPARSLFIFTFAVAAGSGIVIDSILKNPSRYARILLRWCKIMVVVVGIILLVLVVSKEPEGGKSLFWKIIVEKSLSLGDRFSISEEIGTKEFLESSYNFARKSLWMACLWIILSGGALAIATRKHRSVQRAFTFAVLIIVLLDLLWASGRYVTGAKSFKSRLESQVLEILNKEKSSVPIRIASSRDTEDLSLGSLSGISHVGGYGPAQFRRYSEYVNVLESRPYDEEFAISTPIRPGKLLKLMGISYVLTSPEKPPYPGGEIVLQENFGNLYKIKDPYPHAFLIHQVKVIRDKKTRLNELTHINPLKEAIVEEPLQIKIQEPVKGKTEKVAITQYSAHKVEVSVSAETAGVLVLTDAYYPAWRAEIDGKRTRIFPIDHLFRGIEVPEGEHKVTFTYDKTAYTTGKTISLGSLSIVVLILICSAARRKKHKRDE